MPSTGNVTASWGAPLYGEEGFTVQESPTTVTCGTINFFTRYSTGSTNWYGLAGYNINPSAWVTADSATLYIAVRGAANLSIGQSLGLRIYAIKPGNLWYCNPSGNGFTWNRRDNNGGISWLGGANGCGIIGTDTEVAYSSYTAVYTGNNTWHAIDIKTAVQAAINAGHTSLLLLLKAVNGPVDGARINWYKANATFDSYVNISYSINNPPQTPTALWTHGDTVTGSGNPLVIDTFTPEFSFVHNDPDAGDYAQYYRIQVSTDSSFVSVTHWDSGKTQFSEYPPGVLKGGRCNSIPYGGSALSSGITYYWRTMCWDDDDVSGPWSPSAANSFYIDFTPYPPTSLRTEGSVNNTNVLTLAPDFDFLYNDPNPLDYARYYQIQVTTDPTFSSITHWDSGKAELSEYPPGVAEGNRCDPITYDGLDLAGSTTYYWRSKFWDEDDNEGDWSSGLDFFELGSIVPNAPTKVRISGNPSDSQVANPITFSACYEDPFPPGDQAIQYRIQVNTQADFLGRMLWDSGQVVLNTPVETGERTEEILYRGYSLTPFSVYYVRVKLWDLALNESPWSVVE